MSAYSLAVYMIYKVGSCADIIHYANWVRDGAPELRALNSEKGDFASTLVCPTEQTQPIDFKGFPMLAKNYNFLIV